MTRVNGYVCWVIGVNGCFALIPQFAHLSVVKSISSADRVLWGTECLDIKDVDRGRHIAHLFVSYNGRSSFKLEVSACFGRIYAKIGMIQTISAWSRCKLGIQNH